MQINSIQSYNSYNQNQKNIKFCGKLYSQDNCLELIQKYEPNKWYDFVREGYLSKIANSYYDYRIRCEGKWGPDFKTYDRYLSVLKCESGVENGEICVNAGILGGYSSGICPYNFDDFFDQLKKAIDGKDCLNPDLESSPLKAFLYGTKKLPKWMS